MPNKSSRSNVREPMSRVRKTYFARLVGRCLILLITILLFWLSPDQLDILDGWRFFDRFSLLHLLWIIWVIDMIYQLIPIKELLPLSSQKLFKLRFKPIREKMNYQALKNHIASTTRSAYKVFLIWAALIIALGALYYLKVISGKILFLISVIFYVCDLICVLIWCPFRLIMRNRCCTTCRIFNWDHMMMFTPMIYVNGFFSASLLILAFIIWGIWELFVAFHPERFWDQTNEALQCAQCTDKLCTQYCQKLRK